jgi:hypothetical protein
MIGDRCFARKGFGVTACQKNLLGNCLDALDRLFDRHSSVVDVWALLLATSEALRATEHYRELERPLVDLSAVIRSGASAETQRERALGVTDELRHYLAPLLRIS